MSHITKSFPPSAPSIARHHALQREALAAKSEVCGTALAESRRLAEIGKFGGTFAQIMIRAEELLDEMDEILIGLHPVRGALEFSRVAALHRELEEIQAALPQEWRRLARRSTIGSSA